MDRTLEQFGLTQGSNFGFRMVTDREIRNNQTVTDHLTITQFSYLDFIREKRPCVADIFWEYAEKENFVRALLYSLETMGFILITNKAGKYCRKESICEITPFGREELQSVRIQA